MPANQKRGTFPKISIDVDAKEQGMAVGQMVPLLYAFPASDDSPEIAFLQCARCATTLVNPVSVRVTTSGGPRIDSHVDVDIKTGKAIRRSAPIGEYAGAAADREATVLVYFQCESGHGFVIDFFKHKGYCPTNVYTWDLPE
ncbi:hypothetical protein [Glaciibacter superstes]|uniref:hypothetical protein n=1 Tax=Glaciibacter superstes TaxID=501023 RepID=UPI0003B4111F|nr:hypothetical protein [Glaciibacter superstes]